MPEYSDIYVISEKRDSETVTKFLNHFLPEREESADEYEIPQYSDSPELILTKANELVEYCCNNKSTEHAIYWRGLNQRKPEHGMIFYLQDGNVIYGLSTDASDSKFANELLLNLKEHVGTNLGYIGHEASPDVDDLNEFKQQIAIHKP
jgi:hypothetical protein